MDIVSLLKYYLGTHNIHNKKYKRLKILQFFKLLFSLGISFNETDIAKLVTDNALSKEIVENDATGFQFLFS